MKYIELKKYLLNNRLPSICILEGEERYFLDGGEKLLCSSIHLERSLDYISFEGALLKEDKLKSLVAAAESFPFMSDKRVVKVSNFFPTEKEYEKYLKGLFNNPPENMLLIIVNSSKGKAECAKLSSKENVLYVDCSRSDEETMKKWILLTCKKSGVFIDAIACGRLVEYCVGDMSRISKETEKLLLLCEAEETSKITETDVTENVYPDSEYKIYELGNAIGRKNYNAFVRILTELKTKGFDETSLLSSLAFYFKGLYEVSETRGSDREAATALGIKEYAVKKNREQAKLFSVQKVKEEYSILYELIARIKMGEVTPATALKEAEAQLFFA